MLQLFSMPLRLNTPISRNIHRMYRIKLDWYYGILGTRARTCFLATVWKRREMRWATCWNTIEMTGNLLRDWRLGNWILTEAFLSSTTCHPYSSIPTPRAIASYRFRYSLAFIVAEKRKESKKKENGFRERLKDWSRCILNSTLR